MSKLSEIAYAIKQARAQAKAEELKLRDAELEKDALFILTEFEEAFSAMLPLLKEEGITYSAHFNTRYTYQGSYILFKKENRCLKMDFLNRDKYRYEYTGANSSSGTAVFGQWPAEDFILFIDAGLLQAPESDAVKYEPDPDSNGGVHEQERASETA